MAANVRPAGLKTPSGRVRRVCAIVFCTGLLAFVLAPMHPLANDDLPMARPESVGMSSKRLERISAFVKDFIERNQIAGAVTLVARSGKIVHFEAQGKRYQEEQLPMEKDVLFSLASMTKPIASTALMMLWEEGKFMLDDPISRWLPSYANKMVSDPVAERRERVAALRAGRGPRRVSPNLRVQAVRSGSGAAPPTHF